MTTKAGGATVMAGGRRKNIKYKTEWGYRGTHSSRTEWYKVFGTNRYRCLLM